jgi:hypothetical protein
MNKLILIFLLVFVSYWSQGQVRWEQIKPISAQMEKTTVVGNDIILIEDAANGARKYIKISNLFADILDSINSKVSNEAYDAGVWNTITTIAPSKKAVRDKIETMTSARYCADSMVVNAGNLTAGTVTDLCAVGGTDVSITELGVADPLRVSFKFSNVEKMNYFVFYGNYNGSAAHILWVEIYNPATLAWNLLGTFSTNTTKQWYSFPIFQPNIYISGGVVRVRINHQDTGIDTHTLILDYVDINFGGAGGGTTISADNVSVTPVGNISNTNVQSALQELDTEKEPVLTKGLLTDDIIGLDFSTPARQVIGGASQLSLTPGYTIPTIAHVTRTSNHVTNDADTSITNEIQKIDTFGIASHILELSLEKDLEPKKTVSLRPYIDLQQNLSYNSNITHNYNNGQDAKLVLTGNVSTYTLQNVPESGEGEIVIIQDATGGWGITNVVLANTNTLYVEDVVSGISLTTAGNSGASTLVSGILNVPNYTLSGLGGIRFSDLSSAATGLNYNNTNGVFSLTAGYTIPTSEYTGYWNTAYSDRFKWDGGSTGLTAATGRTSLGGTTIGQSMFTLTNPSAITFPRFNADNTVSTLSAGDFRTAIGAGDMLKSIYDGNQDNKVDLGAGGTGVASFNSYELLIGSTGNFIDQVSGTGTLGQVLTSNGAATKPTWQTSSDSYISNVSLSGNTLSFTGVNSAFNSTVSNIVSITADNTFTGYNQVLKSRAGSALLVQNINLLGIGVYAQGGLEGVRAIGTAYDIVLSGSGKMSVTFASPPANSSATGEKGTVIITENYIYVCTATNTWKRVVLDTW